MVDKMKNRDAVPVLNRPEAKQRPREEFVGEMFDLGFAREYAIREWIPRRHRAAAREEYF
jgi:hypothetical protein